MKTFCPRMRYCSAVRGCLPRCHSPQHAQIGASVGFAEVHSSRPITGNHVGQKGRLLRRTGGNRQGVNLPKGQQMTQGKTDTWRIETFHLLRCRGCGAGIDRRAPPPPLSQTSRPAPRPCAPRESHRADGPSRPLAIGYTAGRRGDLAGQSRLWRFWRPHPI